MNTETHSQLANFIWDICNLLRGPYKRNEYREVILPLTVLRRFDCLLAPTKQTVLDQLKRIKTKPETVVRSLLQNTSGYPFYNLSKLDFPKLLDDPNQLAQNLNSYINAFSPNVRGIMERFSFDQQIVHMAEKNILFEVIKAFCDPMIDLLPERVDNMQMGYVFEELIRIGAEQSNEEAGEHFIPREVIILMVNLLLSPEKDLARSHETAEICRDRKGNPEPDVELRDTETVPLKEDIEEYFKPEVLPHVPDAWIDHDKTKVGYEIPLNRHFYVYEPPRSLEEIEEDIRRLEGEIIALLGEVTA